METHKNLDTQRAHGASTDAGSPATTPETVRHDEGEGQTGGGGHKPRPVKNNVRKLRTELMMSKAELARRAGVSTLTIDRVERGLGCRMDTKRKILEALGLKPQDRTKVFGDDE
jgi:DNA-binding XRE family transcriptional regulator